MARRLSWLARLPTIARTVDGSSRSHYDRKDLQQLFEIQARSAQILMAAMQIVSVGRTHLVERAALSDLLRKLGESADPSRVLAQLHSKKSLPARRKLKNLSLNGLRPNLNTLPESLTISPGLLTVQCRTIEQLAETMVYIAVLLQEDTDGFALRFEAPREQSAEESDHEQRIQDDIHNLGLKQVGQ